MEKDGRLIKRALPMYHLPIIPTGCKNLRSVLVSSTHPLQVICHIGMAAASAMRERRLGGRAQAIDVRPKP